ncbi:MAG TPA: hypothetical protein VMS08_03485 [Candidatus Saccharimonadia bacterium]|nr:hypothetical protein [Candidatus Saccharimonadia bacterium]
MNQTDVDWLLAWAQIIFAAIMLLGIFGLVFVLIFFNTNMTPTAVTIMTSVITALVTILTLMMNFFYARSRPLALPDPSTTTTTTHIETTPTPTIVPAGSSIVTAPSPPAAIVTEPSPMEPPNAQTPPPAANRTTV